jgi:hypothetical protein
MKHESPNGPGTGCISFNEIRGGELLETGSHGPDFVRKGKQREGIDEGADGDDDAMVAKLNGYSSVSVRSL